MIKNALLICLIYSFASCTGNGDFIISACGAANPIQDLEWLKTEVDNRNQNQTADMKYCYIVQALFDGKTVFIYEDCNPLIDKEIFILNCEGTIINTQDNPVAFDQIKNKKIIWKPKNFVCKVSP